MADHSKPTVLSTESGFVTEMHGRINDTAMLFDATDVPSPTNQPTGTQRINRSTASLQRWSGTAWATFGGYIPSGTTMLFAQAAAPVGWTKLTTHNNKALRVVSGTGGGSGGSVGFTTAFADKSVTVSSASVSPGGATSAVSVSGSITGGIAGTTLSDATMAYHRHNVVVDGFAEFRQEVNGGSLFGVGAYSGDIVAGTFLRSVSANWAGGGQAHGHGHNLGLSTTPHSHSVTVESHSHNVNVAVPLNPQYVDVIICSKD